MYVCVCNAVTEREIEHAVNNGCNSLGQLKDQLGVATRCGTCACEAATCLQKSLEKQMDKEMLMPI